MNDEKTHRIGLRTSNGRSFWRFGKQIAPKNMTQLEVTAAELKALERECATNGCVLEVVEKPTPIEKAAEKKPKTDDAGDGKKK